LTTKRGQNCGDRGGTSQGGKMEAGADQTTSKEEGGGEQWRHEKGEAFAKERWLWKVSATDEYSCAVGARKGRRAFRVNFVQGGEKNPEGKGGERGFVSMTPALWEAEMAQTSEGKRFKTM